MRVLVSHQSTQVSHFGESKSVQGFGHYHYHYGFATFGSTYTAYHDKNNVSGLHRVHEAAITLLVQRRQRCAVATRNAWARELTLRRSWSQETRAR